MALDIPGTLLILIRTHAILLMYLLNNNNYIYTMVIKSVANVPHPIHVNEKNKYENTVSRLIPQTAPYLF